MKKTYKNRYNDIFTFELLDDGNILWTGNFEYVRIGFPNDYTEAYNEYVNDYKHSQSIMSFNQFKNVIHEYDDETHQFYYDKYLRKVNSLTDKISMVDPSGGPYICVGTDMKTFINSKKPLIVKDIIKSKDGYNLIIEK